MTTELKAREAPASYMVGTQRVRLGYKQTEVGVIPEDWDVDSIVNLAAITTGDKNTQDRIEDGAYPFFVRSSTVERINSYTFDGEAVLTAGDGVGTGKIFHYINGKFDFHQRVYKISNFSDRLIGHYFYLYFSNNFYSRIMQMTAKSSVDSVRRDMIADMKIPVPLPDEQRAIAAALSDVDALLAKLDQLIAKKRDLKQAAMQQLLTGSTRLPGFGGEWEVKRLGDVAEMGSGGTPLSSVAAYYDGDIMWVSISDMTNGGKIIDSTERNLTALGFANSATQMFPAGTVLYAMYASIGECSIAGKSLCTSQAILGIRPKSNLSAEFLYYYLTSLKVIVKTLGQQGTQSNLNKGMVQDFRLNLPLLPEQTAIATILSDMDAEIAALEARRDKIRDLKQGMMQELLTGRIRLV